MDHQKNKPPDKGSRGSPPPVHIPYIKVPRWTPGFKLPKYMKDPEPNAHRSHTRDLGFLRPTPPPPGEEYPRLPSPPLPTIVPNAFSPNEYIQMRNEGIENPKIPYKPPEPEREDLVRERIRLEAIMPPEFLDYAENHNVYDSDNPEDPPSGSEDSPTTLGKSTVEQIVKNEVDSVGPSPFSHNLFHRALQAKWHIMTLLRMERILKGEELPELSPELLDHDSQFQSIYGPMNTTHENYSMLVERFKASRFEMVAEMHKGEKELMEWITNTKTYFSEETRIKIVKEISTQRKTLEADLASLFEANTDTNPYTSVSRMDYFVVPRILHPISIYVVRPTELMEFTEFKLPENLWSWEGYNSAICDVSSTYVDRQRADLKREDFFNGSRGTGEREDFFNGSRETGVGKKKTSPSEQSAVYENWDRHVFNLSKMIMNSPCGVEISFFTKTFKAKTGLGQSEALFGDFTDYEGVKNISEIFHLQKLGRGENRKDILFPALLEGMIVTPEEILIRTWNRLRFLYDEEKSFMLDNMLGDYEKFFGHKMIPSDWGFKDMEEFVIYSKRILPLELKDVKIVDIKEKRVSLAYQQRHGVGRGRGENFQRKKNMWHREKQEDDNKRYDAMMTSMTNGKFNFILDEELIPWAGDIAVDCDIETSLASFDEMWASKN